MEDANGKVNAQVGPEFWQDGTLGGKRRTPRILFGHVREDIDVEIGLARQLVNPARAMVVTSGGCTAMALRPSFSEAIYSLDVNAAQNRLAELKLTALQQTPAIEELRRYHNSDARSLYPAVRHFLLERTRDFWDANAGVLRFGLHRCGEIDRKLARLRVAFHFLVKSKSQVRRFLQREDEDAQRTAYAHEWNTWRWRGALSLAFHPWLLRTLLRADAVKIPSDLTKIMEQRFEQMLTGSPARRNRAAHELFLGEFPPDWQDATPHLREELWRSIRDSQTPVTFVDGDAASWLWAQPPESLDLISISNILEQSQPAYRTLVLQAAERALTSGGILVGRSILPWPAAFHMRRLRELPAADLPKETSGICSLVRVFRK